METVKELHDQWRDPLGAQTVSLAIDYIDALENALRNANSCAINIILDEADIQSPIFVEIENDQGASIGIGERVQKDDDLTAIRITAGDIMQHETI